MWRKTRGIALGLAVIVTMTACFGSFNLTKKLYNWNASPGDKWVQEGYFLVTGVLLPVYSIAAFADVIIFNSIEFWTGDNPVGMASSDTEIDGTVISRGEIDGEEVVVEFNRDGERPSLTVTHNVPGEAPTVFHVVPEGHETVFTDAEGKRLMSAAELQDGSLLIKDRAGVPVKMVAAEDIQAFYEGMRSGEIRPSEFAQAELQGVQGLLD